MKKKHYEKIVVVLKRELSTMYKNGKGKSKQEYRDETTRLRKEKTAELVAAGWAEKDARKEAKRIDAARELIFDSDTLFSYQKAMRYFGQYCDTCLPNGQRISIEEAIEHIQDFLDYGKEVRGWAPSTLNLYKSAIAKATKTCGQDYHTPTRRYSEFTRSRKPAANDTINEKKYGNILKLNTAIGLRDAELGRLKSSACIQLDQEHMIVHSIGKGKRFNSTEINTKEEVDIILKAIKAADADGREYLLTKKEKELPLDIHHTRTMKAINEYIRIFTELYYHPEKRAAYIDKVNNEMIASKKQPYPIAKLNFPIYLKNPNKDILKKKGCVVVFDRLIVAYVSLFTLNHYGVKQTYQNYLCQMTKEMLRKNIK